MKKSAAALIFTALAAAFLLTACGGASVDGEVLNNISDLRLNVYTAKSESAEIVVITGRRERPYKTDGVSEQKGDYTAVSLKPATQPLSETVYTYVLKNGSASYEGRFTPHPFGVTFTAEIAKKLTGGASLTVSAGEYSETLTLEAQFTEGMLEWREALRKGLSAVAREVGTLYSDKKLEAEVYVQFIGDPLNGDGGYFWYVAFAGRNGKTYAALLDPVTGDVMASKRI